MAFRWAWSLVWVALTLAAAVPVASATTTDAPPLELLDAVNAARASNGLPPLQLDERLDHLSQDYAATMAEADCMAHDCGGQGRVGERASRAGIAFRLIGEALAGGPAEAGRVVDLWMGSTSHRAILLNPEVTTAGVGHVFIPNDTGKADYGHYWVLTVGLSD